MTKIQKHQIKNLLLVLVWIAIALGLRLTKLASKPPWTDEFSTLVFSLGNSFLGVPLNQAITTDVLLQPLQPNPNAGVTQVVQHLITESNHPPLYFILTHLWLNFWSANSVGLVSVWAARSLAAIFGVISIPAIYALGLLAFRSQLISQLAAAIMAVSPYGIFLAQEARHYTIAILWVIASFSCLVIAVNHIHRRVSIPIWLTIIWVSINFLGIATHYFFVLTLCAEAVVLLKLWLRDFSTKRQQITNFDWRQIYIVATGTLIAGLIWLPVFLHSNNSDELTQWIQNNDRNGWQWLSPIFQAIAAWITMLSLLPVEASDLGIVIASGAVMIIFFVWVLPQLTYGIKVQLQQPNRRLMTQLFIGIIASAIALFFFFTYVLGIDLTRGARYNFVYFPAVIVLLGASLAVCWHNPVKLKIFPITGQQAVAIVWLMGLLSAITVVCNLGYQKYYRPDLLMQLISTTSPAPVLIATTHKTHVQIGEMMGIAREFKLAKISPPKFLLAHQEQNPNAETITLQQTLKALPKPLDLWLVNFYAPAQLHNCTANSKRLPPIDGYNYQLYHCE